jgi:hypothetical protein
VQDSVCEGAVLRLGLRLLRVRLHLEFLLPLLLGEILAPRQFPGDHAPLDHPQEKELGMGANRT